MKPRNKFQKTIIEHSKKLPALSAYQEKQAIKHVAPHIAKLNSKGEYVCMDCGHSWKMEKQSKSSKVVCPHCFAKLEVDKDRKRKYVYKDYFALVTRIGGFQVVRMFMLSTSLYKGKTASWWMDEAFQRWITPDGKDIIVGRKRNWLSWYCDSWDFYSDMEIRPEHYAYSVSPYKVIGHVSAIPELTRNGFKGDFHNCNPAPLIKKLLTNCKIETLWKAGQFSLASYFVDASYSLDNYWSSIKIAIRNRYIVSDASLWIDLLGALRYLEKDLRNPKFICPDNLKEAHDCWVHKRQVKEEKIRRMDERRREMNQEQKYLSDKKRIAKDDAKYKKSKSQYFNLEFKDSELTVKPLTCIQEFIDEWHTMHHCVFTNKYYQKEKSLILHALVDGVSVATIEMDIDNLTIIQCRGVHNSVPHLKDRIIALIESNKYKIAQKRTA